MAEPLFFSQEQLEGWIEKGEVTFAGDVLTLLKEQKTYKVEAAVRVKSLIDGKDQNGLIGRVLTVRELEGMKAEHFQNTVILGDTGYECDEGFVGSEKGSGVAPEAKAPQKPEEQKGEPKSDADLLTDFLLKNL